MNTSSVFSKEDGVRTMMKMIESGWVSGVIQLTDKIIIAGDDRGRLWFFMRGELVLVRKVFSAPVSRLDKTDQVLMVASYNSFLIFSVSDITHDHHSQELKVRIGLYLLLVTRSTDTVDTVE